MKREELESMREDIIATLHATYNQVKHAHNFVAPGIVDIAKLNAFHELVCRELDRPECQHKLDDLLCSVEVAIGHLMRCHSLDGDNARNVLGALRTLDGISAKGGA